METRVTPLLPFLERASIAVDVLELYDRGWFGPPCNSEPSTDSPTTGASDSEDESLIQPSVSVRSRDLRDIEDYMSDTYNQPFRNFVNEPMDPLEPLIPLADIASAEAFHGGLGTWAGRQRFFMNSRLDSDNEVAESSGVYREENRHRGENDRNSKEIGLYPVSEMPDMDVDKLSNEDDAQSEAWRWKFSRKWQMEQLQQASTPAKEDDDFSALEYLAATGGLNLQFGDRLLSRSDSIDTVSLSRSTTMLLDASLTNDGVGLLSTPQGSGLASKDIARKMKRAEELMSYQIEIERQVAERWQTTERHHPWSGIRAVYIESWGSFPFLLVRIIDPDFGCQKILVRGKNNMPEARLLKVLEQEIAEEASARRVQMPRIEKIGVGKMVWAIDRERHLQVVPLRLESSSMPYLTTLVELGRATAALVRTSLGVGFSVATN